MTIRTYKESDIPEMVRIWNEVIETGIYFDYDEILDVDYVRKWFAEQTATVVAEDDNGHINCVVEGNMSARHLYEKLGFTQIGTIHGGLQIKDGTYVNTCPYYIEL